MSNIEMSHERLQPIEVYLYPCSGVEAPRGHVYHVLVGGLYGTGGRKNGFLPLDKAMDKYPNATILKSDSLCPPCVRKAEVIDKLSVEKYFNEIDAGAPNDLATETNLK